jgi:tellurite resistance protein TerC
MHVSTWAWVVLLVATPVLLALDLLVFPRGSDAIAPRAAWRWALLWTVVGVAFAGVVWLAAGESYAIKYTTGFAVEKALTVDQALVFALVVTSFAAPAPAARRAIFYALWVGLLFKLPFIALGTAIARSEPESLHWVIAGAFVVGGLVFLLRSEADPDAAQNRYLRLLRRRLDFTDTWDGGSFVVHDAPAAGPDRPSRRRYTLAFAMLVVLLTADIYFAATVPLAFAIKKPGFLVLASSTFALLGIRSLYWWVASLEVDRVKLRIALALVLWLVALELLLEPYLHAVSWLLPELVLSVIAWPLVSARRRRRPVQVAPYPRPVQEDEAGSDAEGEGVADAQDRPTLDR